jgi:hypothetical protein
MAQDYAAACPACGCPDAVWFSARRPVKGTARDVPALDTLCPRCQVAFPHLTGADGRRELTG